MMAYIQNESTHGTNRFYPDEGMIRKRFQVNKDGEVLINHILEGHEGIARVTTMDKSRSVIEISTSKPHLSDLQEILHWLKERVYMREIPDR